MSKEYDAWRSSSTYRTCDNCGERIHSLGCVNCNEPRYIERQYLEDGERVPRVIIDLCDIIDEREARLGSQDQDF